MLIHCTSVQIRSQIWKLFYCRTCTAGDSLYCRLPGMGLLILCSTCKASLFWGDGQGSCRFIPHVSYAVNLPVIGEKKKKGLYTSQISAMVCATRTFFNTVDGINVSFLTLFLDMYFPVHGLRQIIVTQAERLSPDKLFKSIVLYGFQNCFALPQLQISCIVK